MASTTRWRYAALLLGTGGALACGRTHLAQVGPPDAGRGPSPAAAEDAALAPDLAPLSSPDLPPRSPPDTAFDLRGPSCGDGFVDPGETCDDGNTLPGDGCDPTCQIECGWSDCPSPPYPRQVVCGDGLLGAGELCDDGNLADGDGCSSSCAVEPGFHCPVPGRRCSPICGDGLLVGSESCDDGNSMSGDGCSSLCLTEPCWDCSSGACLRRLPYVDGGNCAGLPVDGVYCGNGKLEGAEECDDGSANDDSNYGGCSTHCRYLLCGDGIVNGPETCDLGWGKNTAVYGARSGCTDTCTVPAYCGDGKVDSAWGEECDDGPFNDSGLCTLDCRVRL